MRCHGEEPLMEPTEQAGRFLLTDECDNSFSPTLQAAVDDLVAIAENSRQPFEPELTLFVDESPDSQQAQAVLQASGQRFRILRASGSGIPALVFAGVVAERLSGVKRAARALAAFDAALARGLPEVIAHHRG
jgi:hypothetical protein